MNQLSPPRGDRPNPDPALTNTELAHLRVRVVALENLLITLLAQTSAQQLGLARDMAAYISPRPGYTDHPLTVHAAAQMLHLTQRAARVAHRATDLFPSKRSAAHRTNLDPREYLHP